jgi:hypothetical protein
MQENSNPKAFREKPESQIFAKRARHMSVARASPLSDVSVQRRNPLGSDIGLGRRLQLMDRPRALPSA